MQLSTPISACLQRHYTVARVAELWGVSTDTVRRLFEDEPDVIVIWNRRRGTRVYRTILIPEFVLERVYRRLMNGRSNGH